MTNDTWNDFLTRLFFFFLNLSFDVTHGSKQAGAQQMAQRLTRLGGEKKPRLISYSAICSPSNENGMDTSLGRIG
jgi:hypothetical protein